MKNERIITLVIVTMLLALPLASAAAQGTALTLRLTKQYGFNGFDGKIQGSFLLKAEGPQDLSKVSFYIDGELMGVDEQAPFEVQFSTGRYAPGLHTYSAEGRTSSGETVRAEPIQAFSISEAEAHQAVIKIVLPILLLTFGAVALSALVPLIGMRKGHTRPVGSYGPAGGAVCPRCAKPFSRHMFSPNLLAGKLERCPHCGKWAVVRRAGPAELAAAEERLRADNRSAPLDTEDERAQRLRQVIEDSKYEE